MTERVFKAAEVMREESFVAIYNCLPRSFASLERAIKQTSLLPNIITGTLRYLLLEQTLAGRIEIIIINQCDLF